MITLIIGLSLAFLLVACDDGLGGGTHIHSYSDAWGSFNATQHWKECTANDGAKTDIADHDGNPCTVCGYDSSNNSVTFSNVTANGRATTTTTMLTLTFSAAIPGLSANDITLSGVAVSKGTLGNSGSTYTLPISGFTAGGTLTVAVSKSGYNISGSPKTVAIYHYTSNGPAMTWTAVPNSTFGSDDDISEIAYGNGRFVAVGDSGKIAYSTNDTSWTAVSNSPFGSDNINDIAYGGGRFVAVGNYGTMAYSTDGIGWTAVSNSTFDSRSIFAVAYGSNQFVAVGQSGKMAYSTNGTSWTAVPDSTIWDYIHFDGSLRKDIIQDIAYGSNRFVAVSFEGRVAYSTNGTSWTAVSNSPFGSSAIFVIAYANNRFVAGGTVGKMAYSANGTSWTTVPDSAFGFDSISGIAYGNNRFVAVGSSGKMAYSTNGTSWTTVSDSAFGSAEILGIIYASNRFIAVGQNGKMAYADW